MGYRGRKTSLLMGAAAGALALSAIQAAAQGGAEVELAPVVVEGQQQKKTPASPATDTPLATQTTAEEVRKNEISNIDDLGNTTEPGVEYSKGDDSINIRGLSGPRVATTVDDIPIPFLQNGARGTGGPTPTTNADGGGSAFDFSSLSAADVLRGADSSRIGSGGLAGALVLRTLEPTDILEDGRNFGGLTKLTYDSRDNSFAGALAIAGRAGNTSALLQGAYKAGDQIKSNGDVNSYGETRTEADPADRDQDNLLFKLRQDLAGGHQIGLTAERYHRQIDTDMASSWTRVYPSPTSPTRYEYLPGDRVSFEETQRERVSLDYRFESPDENALIENAFARLYWQDFSKSAGEDGIRQRVLDGVRTPYFRDNGLEETSIGLVGGIQGNFATGNFDHEWRVGVDVAGFDASHFIEVFPATPSARDQSEMPDVEGARFGIYVDDKIAIGDSGFALTPGVRFDWHEYKPQANADFVNNPGFPIFGLPPANSGSRFSPKLLATYDVNPDLEIYAQVAGSYRAPTYSELYLNFTNPTPGYAQVGNPDLKAETGVGFELGANYGDDDFGGRISVFHNRYKNFIDATDLAPDPRYPELPFGVGSYVNIDNVEISGVELKAHKRFDNGVNLHGGLAYTYGKNADTGEELDSIAPYKALAGIGYERENWGVDLTGIFVGSMQADDVDFVAPSYATANLTAWWEPSQIKGMRLQAGVYNLTDETYYNALNVREIDLATPTYQPEEFYSEPGRTFKLSLTQKF